MTETLEVHLTTDDVSSDLKVHFVPDEGSVLPVGVEDWPDLRDTLRKEVRDKLDDERAWVAHLDSDRPDHRLDVRIGVIEASGTVTTNIDLWFTSAEDVDWNGDLT